MPKENTLSQFDRTATLEKQTVVSNSTTKSPPAQIAFSSKWLKSRNLKAENLAVYPVTGNGMKPIFNNGDYVMLDSSKTIIEDYKIYGLIVRGEFRIKRLVVLANGDLNTFCDCVNASNDNEIIRKDNIENDVLIIGMAVHRQGSIH